MNRHTIRPRHQLARICGRLLARTGRRFEVGHEDIVARTVPFALRVGPHRWVTEVDASAPIRDYMLNEMTAFAAHMFAPYLEAAP